MFEKINNTSANSDTLKVGANKINDSIELTNNNLAILKDLSVNHETNLFNRKTVLKDVFIDDVNKTIKKGSGYFASAPIEIDPSTSYTIYASDNRYITPRYAWLDADLNLINAKKLTSAAEHTINSPTNGAYLMICDSANVINAIDFMIEKGSKTSYEPFKMTIPNLKVEANETAFAHLGKNLFNKDLTTRGKFIDQLNLDYADNSAHELSGLITVTENTIYTISGDIYGVRVAYFDESKNMMNAELINNAPFVFTTPAGCKQIQFSYGYKKGALVQLEKGGAPTEYEEYKIVIDYLAVPENWLSKSTREVKRDFPEIKKETVAANEKIIAQDNNTVINGDVITYFAQIKQPFTSLKVGNGETIAYGSFVEVTPTEIITNVIGASGVVDEVARVAHYFIIKDYIQVTIQHTENGRVNVTASSNGGQRASLKNRWIGRQGEIFAKCDVDTKNVTLSYSNTYANKRIFAFGDSYFDLVSPKRWPYHMLNTYGYDTILYDGFGGRKSIDGYAGFQRTLKYGAPEYALWALGMNDPDTDTAINTSYQTYLNKFLNDCDAYGIKPILCTIPTTPNMQHKFKNDYIKKSGYRYIDIDAGVRIAGSRNWYDGMLNADNVHPDEAGAKAIADIILANFPEIAID